MYLDFTGYPEFPEVPTPDGLSRRVGSARGSTADVSSRLRVQKLNLFDNLISAREERRRHFDAERLSGFEVQGHFKFCALLYGQFARFFAFENAASVDASQTVRVGNAATIADQATGLDKLAVSLGRRYSVIGCQCT